LHELTYEKTLRARRFGQAQGMAMKKKKRPLKARPQKTLDVDISTPDLKKMMKQSSHV
jgi:hypothetical protein